MVLRSCGWAASGQLGWLRNQRWPNGSRKTATDGIAAASVRALDVRLQELVGHHEAGPADGQLDMADPVVLHKNRLVGDRRTEDAAVPVDGHPRVRDAQVGRQLTHGLLLLWVGSTGRRHRRP